MKKILYCEDHKLINETVSAILEKKLPDYTLISTFSLKDALEKAELFDSFALVITDGKLGTSDCKDFGWNLVKQLKEKGYKGPAIYVGLTPLFGEIKDLFDDIVPKEDVEKLIDVIKKYL